MQVEMKLRSLSRVSQKKYHPDRYSDNPLNDLAEEKFREVKEAYDTLMNGSKDSFGGGSSYSQSNYSSSSSSEFTSVRSYIQVRRFQEAMRLLNGMSNKSGEWYYLMSICLVGTGYTNQALNMPKQRLTWNLIIWSIVIILQGFKMYRVDTNQELTNIIEVA